MNISKEEYKEAIQRIANRIDMKDVYSYLLESSTLPEITKKIIYDSFRHELSLDYNNNEFYTPNDIALLREYVIELDTKGFVDFK